MDLAGIEQRFSSMSLAGKPAIINDDDDETCVICMSKPDRPKKLNKCGHAFCSDCIDECFSKMRPCCPICGEVYGARVGDMPHGTMAVSRTRGVNVPGYGACGLITINYHFSNGIQSNKHPHPGKPYYGTSRKAYLPDNSEGRKVCDLLRRAFDAKLTFTVGRSATTGRDDCVIWNDIHHKTSLSGGPTAFGYPDPTYLSRVQQELAAKGIK